MEYFIYMTNDCNLHCEYCSVLLDCQKAGLPIRASYSHEELISFIRTEQKNINDNHVDIYFFGGEPTLEYDDIILLVKSIKIALNGEFDVKFVLHTNGLLLDKIPSILLNEISLVMYSINYEKIPKYNLSASYFSKIISNADFISAAGKQQIARLTITEKTSLYTELMLLLPSFEWFYWQIENCERFSDFDLFYKTYTYEVNLTFDYWLSSLKGGTLLKFIPFISVLKFMFFPDRTDDEFSCGYNRSMIYIQTNGSCYACSDNVESGCHYIGSIKNGIKFGSPSLHSTRCVTCQYRRLCMGRCGRMHKEFTVSHISEYCALNKYMFDLFIKNKDLIASILCSYPRIRDILSDPILEYTEYTP